MRVKPHSHPCQRCGAKTECGGSWEENYDGFPGVICREFHLESGINSDFLCETCHDQAEAELRSELAESVD